ncbi:IS3 family transposase (plasmid) [Nicoliella spurrieriana]|uniref:IS3 family transposase n=1 Tax=Nicoliella spurrieriana TaxID=2925830 RepID=A0A976X4V4_9LACO|nr:IS3 family transposase [Nicoliella spurrieriana]UQS85907.1 IS3 family transposase [Nicoliella spurrieriana]
MAKYSSALKLKVVLEYLSGIGSTTLNRKYDIKGSATIYSWVTAYKNFGKSGLIAKHFDQEYSYMYKLKVLKWMHLYQKSYPETALHFNIASPSSIFTWQRRLENGSLYLMNKHKSHQKNVLTNSVVKQIKILKKQNLTLSIKLEYEKLLRNNDRYESVELLIQKFSNVALSKILSSISFPKSSYYYHKKASLSKRNNELDNKVKQAVKSHPAYGYRRITALFNNNGNHVNHKRIQRIMQKYSLQCQLFGKRKRKYNSYRGQVGHIADNVLNGVFSSNNFGEKITTDVSEFRYGNEDINHRVYLSPVMDLYSDKIIAYGINSHPTVALTLKPLIRTLDNIQDTFDHPIVHSDQGIQYQSHVWVQTLKKYGAIQSMSRKGTCLDNAQMESFFHIMKIEMMNKHYDTKKSLIHAMKSWIKDYNDNRIKAKLGY